MYNISASIVLYHNKIEQLQKAIKSSLNTDLKVKLYLIDNSSNDDLKQLGNNDDRIKYIFNNANLGYGSAHNIAMKKSIEDDVPYHIVLNPDIYFDNDVLGKLFNYMESNKDIGNIIPQVRYPDGEIQHLCKLLPTPVDLILRRFIPSKSWKEKRNQKYELRDSRYDKIINVPSLSGCFMFLRTSVLKDIGLFDENIFMYLEDTDLNRRIHKKYKTIFYPEVAIVHEYAKESYVNKKLLMYHIKSAIYYFNKWGWFFDKERDDINNKCLKELNYKKGER
ncbi:glycosyltransferase family 2 protein [bacterium]|jgi:GT2 family glycosyltransferase|nr:glycosyltransferase family 2 protein [bacterium]